MHRPQKPASILVDSDIEHKRRIETQRSLPNSAKMSSAQIPRNIGFSQFLLSLKLQQLIILVVGLGAMGFWVGFDRPYDGRGEVADVIPDG
jgi:hypothetical protein